MQNYDTIATLAIGLAFRWLLFINLLLTDGLLAQSYASGPVIVLDPGHGGKDIGAHHGKCLEKNICLAISQKTRERILALMPESAVYLTREQDEFIPLKHRSAYANDLNADVFISIHCNAFPGNPKAARGSETYVMGLHKTDDNLQVALRENESLLLEQEAMNLQELQTESWIVLNHLQNQYLQQSIALANLVESRFATHHPGQSKGVKQAGFMVLHQASMPAILVEVGFLSHPEESSFLCSSSGQEEIASMLADAISGYFEKTPQFATIAAAPTPQIKAAPIVSNVYKVQLGACMQDPSENPRWAAYQDLEFVCENGVYKVFSGTYMDRESAVSQRDAWRKIGFKDAFVVPICISQE